MNSASPTADVGRKCSSDTGCCADPQPFDLSLETVRLDVPDGTGVRDYIHVVDLADGHVKAIKKIEENPGLKIYNLGTGKGYSVLDVINNVSKAVGKEIPYVIAPRRAGDIAECYSDATLAKEELGWEAKNGIKEMCEDSWNWQKKNPNGYNDK